MTNTATTEPQEARPMSTHLTVDISNTVGQQSAIDANDGPVFHVSVVQPARQLEPALDGTPQAVMGVGRVLWGPVAGHEVVFWPSSVVAAAEDEPATVRHADGLVWLAG